MQQYVEESHSTFNLEAAIESPLLQDRSFCGVVCHGLKVFFGALSWLCRRCAKVVAYQARSCWQKRRGMDKQVRHEVSVALRSGFVYLLMVVPLLSPRFMLQMPPAFLKDYHWIPFWYVFLVTPYFGDFIDSTWHSILGTGIGITAVFFLNILMPGGAGPYQVGVYSQEFTIFIAVVFTYCVFLLRWSLSGKRYAMSVFSCLLVDFMDPTHDAFEFRRPFHWQGPVFCLLYIVLLAVPLAFITTRPWLPCLCRKGKHKSHRCEFLVTRDLANLAIDTVLCLERLLTYYREDSLNFDVESSCFYIRELGARRTAAESNLEKAWWETCCGRRAHARLRYLHKVSDLLRSLRQTLRIQVEHLRINSAGQRQGFSPPQQSQTSHPVGAAAISPHLDAFVEACKEALNGIVAGSVDALVSTSAPRSVDVMNAVSSAEKSLFAALLELHENTVDDAGSSEMVFVDSLRTWPALLGRFSLQSEDSESMFSRWSLWDWSPHHSFFSREQHIFALRNCLAWCLALWWSVCLRPCTNGCIVTVSVIFSATLGSMTHKNFNRMVGMALGVYVGSLPQELLMGQKYDTSGVTRRYFWHWPEGPIAYLIAMFLIWSISVYGSIATGGKWSYACIVWAGFGGCTMLEHWKFLHPISWHVKSEFSIHTDIMDNFAGCLIIFASDILFTYLCVGIAAEQVTEELPKCLRDVSTLLEGLMDHTVACELEGDALQKRIKTVRTWDEEVKKEDPVWSALCKAPYKEHFINSMLDYCDDVYVASQAIHWSARRCSSKEAASKILLEVFDEKFKAHVQTYAKFTHSALLRTAREHNAVVDISLLKQAASRPMHRKNSSPNFTPLNQSVNSLRPQLSDKAGRDSFLADALSRIRIVTMDHVTSHCDLASLRAAEASAAFALNSSAWSLRSALQRIEVLLREEAFWGAELPKRHGKKKIVIHHFT